jgi:hypothetical protein
VADFEAALAEPQVLPNTGAVRARHRRRHRRDEATRGPHPAQALEP